MSKAVMQQALEALEQDNPAGRTATIAALRAALAEQERGPGWCPIHQHYKPCEHNTVKQAQPVAWRYKPMVGSPWSLSDDGYYVSCKRDNGYIVQPLYTTPPAPVVPQPLSGLDVERLLEDVVGSLPVARKLIRAVEAEVLKRVGVGR